MKCLFVILAVMFLFAPSAYADTNSVTSETSAPSVLEMYVQGEIYPTGNNDPQAVADAITASNLTVPILALFHVNCSLATCPDGQSPVGSHDGDIAFNDTLIIRDGEYVGDSNWPCIIHSLRAGKVQQIFASFGGYGVPDYARIGKIITKYGTGQNSPLYENFLVLKNLLDLNGIDFDDEDNYDKNVIVSFAEMLLGMGLEITFVPYTHQEFWASAIQALGTQNVKWINLQCYAGGKFNNPADWADMGVPLTAGVCADCSAPQTTCSSKDVQDAFTLWTTGEGSVNSSCWEGEFTEPTQLLGGFIWNYSEVANDLDTYVDAMKNGLS
ncbi:MAG: hypothetical protein GDA56_30605 [Hormoscilla sp. GM7CHS1pb]|nr:hypothetical protein [Hormoscilla sp. GM7CHS1pb]